MRRGLSHAGEYIGNAKAREQGEPSAKSSERIAWLGEAPLGAAL